jgi:hypothetical protein
MVGSCEYVAQEVADSLQKADLQVWGGICGYQNTIVNEFYVENVRDMESIELDQEDGCLLGYCVV